MQDVSLGHTDMSQVELHIWRAHSGSAHLPSCPEVEYCGGSVSRVRDGVPLLNDRIHGL